MRIQSKKETNELHKAESLRSYSHPASQEIPYLLWNLKVYYHVHNSLPLVPILSQMKPVHALPSYLRSILILFSNLCPGLPNGLFPSGFPTKILYAFHTSPLGTTCHTHFILLDLITLIIFSEECKLWSSPLFSFLQIPFTSFLLGPNILLSTMSSNTLNL